MRRLDRRDFFQLTAGLSAAAIAAKTEVYSTPAQEKGEKLRVAVIGVHARGLDHIEGLAGKNDCVVATICDCDEGVIGKAMTLVEKNQGSSPKFEKDLRKVLDDPTIDAVSIATPNHWHALAAIWAMQAGKDVYVEKPVSHNVWEGRQIVNAARKFNRICQTGTQSRSMPGLMAAMAFLHEGKLGKLNRVYGLCYKRRKSIGKVAGEGKIPGTCDYDLWCGPAPKSPLHREKLHYDWHWQWDCGNGDLGNQGIHQVDIGRWGLGKSTMPKSVISFGGRYGYEDDGTTPNTLTTLYDFGDCDMVFEVRGLPTPDFLADKTGTATTDKRRAAHVGLVFYGTQGSMVVTSYMDAISLSPDGEVLKVFSTPKGSDLVHYGNFAKAVRSRKASDLNGEIAEGHLSSALCHLGNISYRMGTEGPFGEVAMKGNEGAEIVGRMKKHLDSNKVDIIGGKVHQGMLLKVDPATEQFVDNAKANEWLRRDYRTGYEVRAVG